MPTREKESVNMSASRRLLVVGAHSADFVWRSAGAVAAHTATGGEALVIALSYLGTMWARRQLRKA